MTTIDECTICGRDASNHSNPNTDYRGMNGDAPSTDHYYSALDDGVESKEGEKDVFADIEKYDNDGKTMTPKERWDWTEKRLQQLMAQKGESKASEGHIWGDWFSDNFKEEYTMDQDGTYRCKHCDAWFDMYMHSQKVAKHHLAGHGIVIGESIASEWESGNKNIHGKFHVIIKNRNTGKVAEDMTAGSLREAESIMSGASINMNHDDWEIVIEQGESKASEKYGEL